MIVRGLCGRDHMVVGITTTYAISEFESHSDGTALCDKVCQ